MITVEVTGFAQGVTEAGRRVRDLGPRIARAVGEVVHRHEARQIERIYSRAIPTRAQERAYRASGKRPRRPGGSTGLMWKRTGALRAGLRLQVEGNVAVLDIEGAAARYAPRRHNLGVTWRPRQPALDIERTNPFATEAVHISQVQIEAAARNVVENALEGL